jgi:transposase
MADLITEREHELYKAKRINMRLTSRRIDNETVLELVFFVARTGIAWNDLANIQTDVHYQTIYKRFQKWTTNNIFLYAWLQLLERYKCSRLSKNAKHFTNMYIDTTMIKNVGGTDCTGRNPTDRGRLGTKVSVIIDEHKIPVSEPPFKFQRSCAVGGRKPLQSTVDTIFSHVHHHCFTIVHHHCSPPVSPR